MGLLSFLYIICQKKIRISIFHIEAKKRSSFSPLYSQVRKSGKLEKHNILHISYDSELPRPIFLNVKSEVASCPSRRVTFKKHRKSCIFHDWQCFSGDWFIPVLFLPISHPFLSDHNILHILCDNKFRMKGEKKHIVNY